MRSSSLDEDAIEIVIAVNINPLNIIAGAVCVTLLYGAFEFIRRNTLLRIIQSELRRIKEREKQFSIRLDDATSKINTLLAHITKQAGILDQKVARLEEKFGASGVSPFELVETEREDRLESRLRSLELVAQQILDGNVELPEDGQSTTVETPIEVTPEEIYEIPALSHVLQVSRTLLRKEFEGFASANNLSERTHIEKLKQILDGHGLSGCWTPLFEAELEKLRLTNKQTRITSDRLMEALRAAVIKNLEALPKLPAIKPGSPKYPRNLIVIGSPASGKTTAVRSLFNYFQSLKKNVVLADCALGYEDSYPTLTTLLADSSLPLISCAGTGKPQKAAYRAIHFAQDNHCDLALFDTGNALDSKGRASDDLKKILKLIEREQPNTRPEVILVVDAAQQEEALASALSLSKLSEDTKLLVTRLDCCSHAGCVLTYSHDLSLPVAYLNLSNSGKDLIPFEVTQFLDALVPCRENTETELEETEAQPVLS